MIYLNNAATSYPKPDSVIKALNESINALPSGQFRSAGIFGNDDIYSSCRDKLARIFGLAKKENIFFTSGSTEGLNYIFKGLNISADQYIITATEHNSVIRPLYNLDGIKGKPTLIPCDSSGIVDPDIFEANINIKHKAIVLNHCSNVTGAIQDVEKIGKIARKHGLIFILDVSQSAGSIPIHVDDWQVDAFAFTGHKSLMGIQGSGGFYVRDLSDFYPLKYGGTGKDSRIISYDEAEYEYEVGTMNSPGIASLNAAADFIISQTVEKIAKREEELINYLIIQLRRIGGVKIYGDSLDRRGPLVSIGIEGIKCSDAAYILQNSYGIITRSGLMCAPLIHDYIGSNEDGTLRLSVSYFTTEVEIDETVEAIRDIAESSLIG